MFHGELSRVQFGHNIVLSSSGPFLLGDLLTPPNYGRKQTSSAILIGFSVLRHRVEESEALKFLEKQRPPQVGYREWWEGGVLENDSSKFTIKLITVTPSNGSFVCI